MNGERQTPNRGADALYPGGPRFFDAPGVFRVSTDSVLLADFASAGNAARILDLGCGGGTLMLLLADKAPKAMLDGVEINPEAASLCRKNIEANGLEMRCRVIEGDLRDASADACQP